MTGTLGAAFMAAMSPFLKARAGASAAAALVLDTLLPPRCLSCGSTVERSGQLCATCWAGINWIDGPVCAACGLPCDYDMGAEALCGGCVARPPAYDRARAVMRYDDGSRPLVLGFKHADRIQAAPAFGAWMARAGAALLRDADLVAPVPLHRLRLLKRRYNQAALLAHATAKAAGRALVPDLLKRTRATPSQAGRSPAGRLANVRGAFALSSGSRDRVHGCHMVLIDDVLTTGATVEACARALKRAGARRVDVLTLARVVRPKGQPI